MISLNYSTFEKYSNKELGEVYWMFEQAPPTEQQEAFKRLWKEAVKTNAKNLTNLSKLYDQISGQIGNKFLEELEKENSDFAKRFKEVKNPLSDKTAKLGQNVLQNSSLEEDPEDNDRLPDGSQYQKLEREVEVRKIYDKIALAPEERRIEIFTSEFQKFVIEKKYIHVVVICKFLELEISYPSGNQAYQIAFRNASLKRAFLANLKEVQNKHLELALDLDFEGTINILLYHATNVFEAAAKVAAKKGMIEAAVKLAKSFPNGDKNTLNNRIEFLLRLAEACVPDHVEKIETILKVIDLSLSTKDRFGRSNWVEEAVRLFRDFKKTTIQKICSALAKCEEKHVELIYKLMVGVNDFSNCKEVFNNFSSREAFEKLLKLFSQAEKKPDRLMRDLLFAAYQKSPECQKFALASIEGLERGEYIQIIEDLIRFHLAKGEKIKAKWFLEKMKAASEPMYNHLNQTLFSNARYLVL